MKTAVEICNDALRILGLRTDCTNIDSPLSDSDKVFKAYFGQVRRKTIKATRPRFACVEDLELAGSPIDPIDPNKGVMFIKPVDCLYLQKVNGATDFTIYGSEIKPRCGIRINPADGAASIAINYVKDVADTLIWTDEFDELMAAKLAQKAATFLTKDTKAIQAANIAAQVSMLEFNSLNAKDAKIKKKDHNVFKHFWPFPARY